MTDTTTFPDSVYKDTVLGPLFDHACHDHAEGFRRIDRAHLVMLERTGILPRDQAARIARALSEIDRDIDPATLSYTGEVEDYFFLREAELKARVGTDTGGRLHTARSRNDIDHTLFKISLKSRLDRLLAECRALLAALIDTADRESTTLIVAYTHGQPAQPTTFGHYLSAVIEVLIRDIARLEEARKVVDLSSMGAAAITTSGFPVDRQLMADLLGFAATQRNSYSCIAAVDYLTATYSAVELLFLHLGRLVQDFQVWSSFEVGQIYVPNAFVQISSIMPQKRNPVPIEHMRHLASQTVGRARMMKDIVHNTPFTDMNDSEGESQAAGYSAFDTGSRMVRLLTAFVPALRINDVRVADTIDRACITITELADTMVRKEGVSFRQAHEIAAETAKAVVGAGESLASGGYGPFCTAFRSTVGRETAMQCDAFAVAVSAEYFVRVRDRFGGPAAAPMRDALVVYRDALAQYETTAQAFARHETAAQGALDTAFTALMETH